MEGAEKIPLTDAQKKELNATFQLEEGADLTTEEIQTLVAMFDTPQKFLLLRKALRVYTPDEMGITYVSEENSLGMNPENWEIYGRQIAVSRLADERNRQALYNFFIQVQNFKMAEKREGFEKTNIKKAADEKQTEDFETEEGQKEGTLPDHL